MNQMRVIQSPTVNGPRDAPTSGGQDENRPGVPVSAECSALIGSPGQKGPRRPQLLAQSRPPGTETDPEGADL